MNTKHIFILMTDSAELTLPITPQEYEIASAIDCKKTNIVSVGDVFVGGPESAQTVKLMSFFPAHNCPFLQPSFRDPQEYINKIEKLRRDKTVFRLIISGTDVNLPVRAQSLMYGENEDRGIRSPQVSQHKRTKQNINNS